MGDLVPQEVTLELKSLRDLQRELIHYLLPLIEWEWIPEFLPLAYIGARVCYSQKHPLLLFEEEKFKNTEKFRSFLSHLHKLGHFSVFAHVPVWVNIEGIETHLLCEIAQSFFKVFWDKNQKKALFNLRHFAEGLENQVFYEKFLKIEPILENLYVKIFTEEGKIFDDRLEKFFMTHHIVERSFMEKDSKNFFAQKEVLIIYLKNSHQKKWIGVITHNFSRIFSHQFVRHTWLNFNQRSHRYTKVDRFVIPSSFDEKAKREYERIIQESMEVYERLCEKIHRESARFLVPQGVATTVFATGPLLVWEDFIQKRNIPQAQEEIRFLASILRQELLEKGL